MNNNYIENLNIGRGDCRFGTQLFQYIFLIAYSIKHNCKIKTNEWIGNILFPMTLKDTIETNCIGGYITTEHLLNDELLEDSSYINKNLNRPFTNSVACYKPYIDYIKSILSINNLKLKPTIGIHIRGTDSIEPTDINKVISWLDTYDLSNKDLFICSEDKQLIKNNFSNFDISSISYINTNSAYLSDDDIEIFSDFVILANCSELFISNSTFSYATALLSPINQKIYRHKNNNITSIDIWKEGPYNNTGITEGSSL